MAVSSTNSVSTSKPKLLDQVRQAIRTRHYSRRTEEAYVNWIKRFILFHNKRHPAEMGEKEIAEFITHLAVKENVAASTQNQALCALLFLYREVLGRAIDTVKNIVWAKRPQRLPTVLTQDETRALFEHLPHAQTLVRHTLAPGQPRHKNRSGIAGTRGRENHHDIYPRIEPWRAGGEESFGHAMNRQRRCEANEN